MLSIKRGKNSKTLLKMYLSQVKLCKFTKIRNLQILKDLFLRFVCVCVCVCVFVCVYVLPTQMDSPIYKDVGDIPQGKGKRYYIVAINAMSLPIFLISIFLIYHISSSETKFSLSIKPERK